MTDYFEIDFLDVESKRSGDAIALRYKQGAYSWIHVVDGGFQDTGAKLVAHINKFYDNPSYVDHVVATHPDGDHAGGLRSVLESFRVGTLWMVRPWMYADTLIEFFPRFQSVENLNKRLKEIYPNIAALETIALANDIEIKEPIEGAAIGAFRVLSPSISHYLIQVINSDKTPESIKIEEEDRSGGLRGLLERVANFVKAAWGVEVFSTEETSPENEMSVIQYATLCGERILLTGDSGRRSLTNAADYASSIGLQLPGIDRFQVPHHGSRRNVSTEVLDRWLGERYPTPPASTNFTAIVSAAKEDKDHPRRAVVRACIHRGARVVSTEGSSVRTSLNAPDREGWTAATPLTYPEDQEE